MAKFTYDQKYSKMLKFLMSFNSNRIKSIMLQRGFNDTELEKGWELFGKATGRSLKSKTTEVGTIDDKGIVAEIDNWENTWFDVADAALLKRYPRVHQELFTNLTKTSGLEVIANVREFTDRLKEMSTRTEPEFTDAMALLATRGLNESKINEVTAKLDTISTWTAPMDVWTVNPEELAIAREEMWDWYMEWSKTARTVVANKRLRISMGISSPTRRTPDSPEIEEDPTTPEEE
ncbi:hypothetical protein KKF34_02150 [Myxococcota bacterium]|nr:hypothetical protein [Myxococcota bacterium]MBU1381447.1 hypothetical protein [Myxococcota bacterium]MBU1495663.1 hypothetical protein [Myxococcota bacterium]